MVTCGRQGPVYVRVVLFTVLRYAVAVATPVAALSWFVVTADHAVAEAELAAEPERPDGGFTAARIRDR
jgi:hypothetical protein